MKSQSGMYSRYFTYIKPFAKLPIVKTYGSTIFTLLIVLILIFFAIKPTVETILVLQKKLTDTESVLQKATQKTNDLSMGKQNYDNLDPAIKNKIQTAIPDNVGLKSVIQTLEQTALRNEASVSALQIQPLTLEPKIDNAIGAISEVKFTFNIEAKYQNIISFLQDINTSSRLITIDSLSLSKASEGSGLIMSIIGKGYFIK